MASLISALGTTAQPSKNGTKTSPEIVRRSAAFHPNVWGDYFLQLSQDEKQLDSWKKKAEELKHQVFIQLSSKEGAEKLELIDTLYHLGVSYNFKKEIEEALKKMYENYDKDAPQDSLYTLALRFRLLRQHGWNASSEVLNKFTEANGSFKESVASDVLGMLSLYEASFVGTKDDKILDEATVFTTKHLRAALPNIVDPIVAERVAHSLELPLHKRLQRLEARYFISLYEKDTAHDKMLLQYAKFDYNLLQALHQNEMQELTKWWKKLDLVGKMKFARDRVTECYYWPLGAHFEPQYSRSRMFVSKIMNITSVIDDLYDVYGTQDELQLFTDAVIRWDMRTIEGLPDYVKPLYQTLLTTLRDFEADLAHEGTAGRLSFLRQAMKDICREYFVEAKWYNAKIVPKVKLYLSCAEITCGYPMIVTASFIGAPGEITSHNLMEWVQSYPKYMQDTCRLCRIVDDIKSCKFEQERGHVASVVECYMNEHKCKEVEAVEKLNEDVLNTWKDINKACIRPTSFPMEAMNIIRNLSRVMEVLYQFGDGYTFSNGKTKEDLTMLLKDPIPI